MYSFKKFNKQDSPFDVDTDREYVSLSELGNGFVFKIDGIFINPKSKFGAHAVVQANVPYPVNISMPNSLTDVFKEILNDNEAVKAIKEGTCFMKVKQYTSKKYNRVCFTADFVEPCEPSKYQNEEASTTNVPF